jgi:hypothetical protein
VPCRQSCDRTLVCGHPCKEPCTNTCPPCQAPCRNRCIHSKCKKKCGEPCTPCKEPCEWQCVHQQCTKPCGEPCVRKPCYVPCTKNLKRCNHPCIGLCGESCPKKCRVCDEKEVTDLLFGDEDEPDARFVQLEDCGHVIEVNALDKWMEMADQSKTGEKIDIQLKACPKCKTFIRRNLRYSNIIKKMLTDIESVKTRMFGDVAEIRTKSRILQSKIGTAEVSSKVSGGASAHLTRQLTGHPTLEQVTLAENQFNLLSMIQNLRRRATEGISHPTKRQKRSALEHHLEVLERWLLKPRMRMGEQELDDVSRELQRLSMVVEMVAMECRALDKDRYEYLDVQTDLVRVR